VIPIFKIELHKKDTALLKQIQLFFGIGNISINKINGSANYQVQSYKDITNVIIPHFDKYPLITQKQADFLLFKSVIELMNKKEHLTSEGLNKIVSIKASINLGLSDVLRESFPNITLVPRPKVEDQEISDPHWLAGFIEGEGCFFIDIFKSKTHNIGFVVRLKFIITQHSRDHLLMNSFIKYLGCGNYNERHYQGVSTFVVGKFSDILNIIIPFLDKYPIQGNKRLDYMDFCKAASLMKSQAHLTSEGLEQIRQIKIGMNRARKYDN